MSTHHGNPANRDNTYLLTMGIAHDGSSELGHSCSSHTVQQIQLFPIGPNQLLNVLINHKMNCSLACTYNNRQYHCIVLKHQTISLHCTKTPDNITACTTTHGTLLTSIGSRQASIEPPEAIQGIDLPDTALGTQPAPRLQLHLSLDDP